MVSPSSRPRRASDGARPPRSNGASALARPNHSPSRASSNNARYAPKTGRPVDLFASFSTGEEPDLDASFAQLGVPDVMVRALATAGIEAPFPIQAATMKDCLAGRDVLGRGRTGSGKTLAFVLPLLTRLSQDFRPRRRGRPRALILVPTRELALQINAVLAPLAKLVSLRSTTVFGGVGPGPQITALREGVDIVIACPGRLDDHVNGNHVSLDSIEVTVLDEADHMADMGFLPSVKKLLDQTPNDGQRLLFSATLDNGVDVLVRRYLHDPILRSVDPVEAVDVKMTHHVLHVRHDDRFDVLRDLAAAPGRLMVFTRTKHGAKRLTKTLIGSGVPAVEMHGNLSQNNRTRNLAMFSDGSASTMVATDIAARGIHVDDVALVVHFDPPADHKAYLHRSGRTARAGNEGCVITLMTDDQRAEVNDLTKRAGIAPTITRVDSDHVLLTELAPGERVFVTAPPERIVPVQAPGRGSAPSARPSGHRGAAAPGPRRGSGGGGWARPSGRAAAPRSRPR